MKQRKPVVMASLLAGLTVLLAGFAGCAISSSTAGTHATSTSSNAVAPSPPERENITFSQATLYATALRMLTDLGLQPSNPCNGRFATSTAAWIQWSPALLPDLYQQTRQIWAEKTPLAPADWQARLAAMPGVVQIQQDAASFCPSIIQNQGTPPPSATAFLGMSQVGTVVRVSFGAPLDTYDAALDAVANLGLRLAGPCIEQGLTAAWHPVGQEADFASTHALVVATTINASNQWQSQLRAISGVTGIESGYVPHC